MRKILFSGDFDILENRLGEVFRNIIEKGPGDTTCLGPSDKGGEQWYTYQTYLLSNKNDRICLYFAENRNNKTIAFLHIGEPKEATYIREDLI